MKNPEKLIEVLLFASPDPLTQKKLNYIMGNGDIIDLQSIVANLNQHYEKMNKGLSIQKIAGGYQILSHPEYHIYVQRLLQKTRKIQISSVKYPQIIQEGIDFLQSWNLTVGKLNLKLLLIKIKDYLCPTVAAEHHLEEGVSQRNQHSFHLKHRMDCNPRGCVECRSMPEHIFHQDYKH